MINLSVTQTSNAVDCICQSTEQKISKTACVVNNNAKTAVLLALILKYSISLHYLTESTCLVVSMCVLPLIKSIQTLLKNNKT